MNQTLPHDQLARAAQAFQQQDWQRAYQLSAQVLRQTPNHTGANYVAGLAALQLQQWLQALDCLQKAAQLDSRNADYAAQYAKALSIVNRPGDALRMANRAFGLGPGDPQVYDTLGVIYTRSNALERAVCAFQRAAALQPDNPVFRYNHATALMYNGDADAAEAEFEACLALDPGYWKACFSLPRLRRQTPGNNHVERFLRLVERSGGDTSAQMYLHMALGKEYEDLGDYAGAFEHFCLGKAAAGRGRQGTRHDDAGLFEAITQMFPEPWQQPVGYPSDEPIFVVGMPRSGTTLVERIISSHPYVHSAGELPNFGVLLKQASEIRTPARLDLETLAGTRTLRWDDLGEKYLASTRPVTEGKPRFIDKLPHNFLYLGHIANALPNARIICLRRNPLDTCLSNFRELFAGDSESHDYALDLLDTGRYYVLFDRLMAHWKRVLPDRILEVRYETLVQTQEASTRQLLEHCGLPWNGACLRFEQNAGALSTASAVQVRSPINGNAVRRWKKYETQLVPLRALLTEAGIDCGT